MGMREAYKSANKQFKEGTEISKNDFYLSFSVWTFCIPCIVIGIIIIQQQI